LDPSRLTNPLRTVFFISRDGCFFGVYDGHGGRSVSEYLRTHLYPIFQLSLKSTVTVEEAFVKSFARVDEDYIKGINPAALYQRASRTAGSCGIVVYLQGKKLFTANVGDSRAILTKRTLECVPLSKEQKVSDDEERSLVIQRTGDSRPFFKNPREAEFDPCAPERLLGHLMVTRAFGDAFLKVKNLAPQHVQQFQLPYITSEPVVTSYSLADNEDDFVVLGSDGLWDMITNEEVAHFLHERSHEWDSTNVAQKLVEHILKGIAERMGVAYNDLITQSSELLDDITVIVVNLKKRKKTLKV